ncbi:hypothetical protein, partial [Rhizobium indigoferae]
NEAGNSSLSWSRNLGRFKKHRGSSRRWMKVQWQVKVHEGLKITSRSFLLKLAKDGTPLKGRTF